MAIPLSNTARAKAQALAVIKAAINQALAKGAFEFDDTRQIIAAFDILDQTVADSMAIVKPVAVTDTQHDPDANGKQIFMNPDNSK